MSDSSNVSYAIVKLTPTIVRHAQRQVKRPVLFQSNVRASGLPDVRVGPGDSVSITIFEAQAGGLFIPGQPGSSAGNFVQLPPQQVDRSGRISVPYAGEINAVGRTPAEIQADIEERLKSRAIEPQAVVTITSRQSEEVSVLGDVNQPARFALEPGGTRILNAIARAGGSKFPGHESVITLQRRGRTDQAVLTSIVQNPSYNVNLTPGDVVYVSHEPRNYLVFGATPAPGAVGGQQNRRFAFDKDNLTLAEAVATAGGLDGSRADPRSVFLFRHESQKYLSDIGVDVRRYKEPMVPTVYTIDMSDTQGFFLANSFYMRDRDVIFVSDAPSVDLLKFLTIIDAITGTVNNIASTRNQIQGNTGNN
ncbi:polysaccharide biosynthesis/export family protein [Microvirga massiliensis]|uniref:polysaccharide biosynthesis/export family protein n=1 Tax=Microvirga massiliensis TaxID=1033741 RepID=UPI00164E5DA1|nr:polysaccharide biosynthesis/export family protein [Microvirga massiliensis]